MRRPTISLTSCGRWLRPRRASVLRRSAILRKCARWSSHTSIESGADAGLHDRLLGRPHGAMRSPAVVCSGSLRFKPPLATCAARRAHDQASSEPIRRPSGRTTKGGLLGLDQMVEAGAGARVVPGARRKPGRAAEIRADLFLLFAKLDLRPWRGNAADSGIITETSWDAVTITWNNGHRTRLSEVHLDRRAGALGIVRHRRHGLENSVQGYALES